MLAANIIELINDCPPEKIAAAVTKVSAWCDHMPIIGEPGAKEPRRQYLVVEASLTNKTDRELEVTLERANLSFDSANEGTATKELTICGADGAASGERKLTLKPGSSKVEFRGDGLYPEKSHGKTLHVTLVFSTGGTTVKAKGAGKVGVTH